MLMGLEKYIAWAMRLGSVPARTRCSAMAKVRGGRAGVVEGACVGENRGVEAVGNVGADVVAGGAGDVIEHGADGAGVRVDPVEVGVVAAALVVVDVDGERRSEAVQSRPA